MIILPSGNCMLINSPIILPIAAPILKVGITTPEGTAKVRASIDPKKLKMAKQINVTKMLL